MLAGPGGASSAVDYAAHCMRQRWPALEAALLGWMPVHPNASQDSNARTYMTTVIKGPWPELAAKVAGDKTGGSRYTAAVPTKAEQARQAP